MDGFFKMMETFQINFKFSFLNIEMFLSNFCKILFQNLFQKLRRKNTVTDQNSANDDVIPELSDEEIPFCFE